MIVGWQWEIFTATSYRSLTMPLIFQTVSLVVAIYTVWLVQRGGSVETERIVEFRSIVDV